MQCGVAFWMRSVSWMPCCRRRVIFVKANTVLWLLRAVDKSCDSVCVGVSLVPAVSEPSSSMMLLCA